MNIAPKSSFVLSSRHLLGIEKLSYSDIVGLLDLAEEFVVLNRQVEKKTASLRGRTLINMFFEASPGRRRRSNSPASASAPT